MLVGRRRERQREIERGGGGGLIEKKTKGPGKLINSFACNVLVEGHYW